MTHLDILCFAFVHNEDVELIRILHQVCSILILLRPSLGNRVDMNKGSKESISLVLCLIPRELLGPVFVQHLSLPSTLSAYSHMDFLFYDLGASVFLHFLSWNLLSGVFLACQ